MRLLPNGWDSEFDPVVAGVGVFFLLGGVYALWLIRHGLRHPVVLVPASIFGVLVLIGALMIFRQFQLWSNKR